MTSETTYREKGRAVVLAALMVLSVVAMSAAFAGSAAAANNPEANGVSYDLDGDDSVDDLGPVWIGQEVTLQDDNLSQYAGFEVRSGGEPEDSSSSDAVASGAIEDDNSTTFDSSDFDSGFYHINLIGGPDANESGASDWDEHVFRVDSESFSASFSSDTIPKNSQVNVTLETDRDDQWVNVSADGVSSDELDSLFNADSDDVEDVISLNLTGVDDETTFEANVSNAELDAGEYEFEFDVTDSSASDTATLQVTDGQVEYDFVDVSSTEEGGIAEITVSTGQSSSTAVLLDSDDTNFATSAFVTGVEGDEVTLEYNTHNVSNAWSVAGDTDASVTDQNHTDSVLTDSPLPAYTWDLTLGDQLGEDDYTLSTEHDRGRLVVDERGGISGVTTETAPADADLSDY